MKKSHLLFVIITMLGLISGCSKKDNTDDKTNIMVENNDYKKPAGYTFHDEVAAYNTFDLLCEEHDCVLLKIRPSNFPQSNSIAYEIYIGERDQDGDCIY